MRTLKVNVQNLSIFVPEKFGHWNSGRQTEFIQEKINNLELVIINYSLRKEKKNEEE